MDGTTLASADREVGNAVDDSHAGDQTCPKSCKLRVPGRENGDTWTSKRTKVSVPMGMIKLLTVHIFLEEKGPPYQGPCWEKRVVGEDICEDRLAIALGRPGELAECKGELLDSEIENTSVNCWKKNTLTARLLLHVSIEDIVMQNYVVHRTRS